ncbi:Os03g0114100, partial [Oryza sativa Japonica Group]
PRWTTAATPWRPPSAPSTSASRPRRRPSSRSSTSRPSAAPRWSSACDCECGTCGDDEWEVVGDDGELDTPEMEAETLTWALEMGAWAVCVGVGLLATARRFRRKRAFW